MSKDDDIVPQQYPYYWSADSELSLQEFLTKAGYKPSMVQDDGTKPWLWVRKSDPSKEDGNVASAEEEASQLLKEVTAKVTEIQDDDSIPIRSNKKKGTKSKKELREAVQNEATEKLKEIAIRHGDVSGKWLIFAPPNKVDHVWATIANSLISGPLSSTSAHLAKVATCPQNETPNYSHVLCLYIPDVYNQQDVTEVIALSSHSCVLLRRHGMNLMGVKSNLYTRIGLDSKHPSGIQSTVWKNTALMPDADIKASSKSTGADATTAKPADTATTTVDKPALSKLRPKLKLKKKKTDDPFGSDDEADKVKGTSKVGKATGEDQGDEAGPSGKTTTAKRSMGGIDEDADERPKKRQTRK
ncbi:hypothetical protein WOLCODRAFT_80886 [Wolfiporia cocos MD-104 SS10]|uniref:DUF1917-domain-containing protein n=1 Tax=Wolfiporia cocos (strain MD-104) TaxID=742152 RepID=A0A2H3J0Y4_WOLCO|nr:hypothetical protein WOLCODRAFT_80886 [Wolfiporia cocos MD-104 SS10]